MTSCKCHAAASFEPLIQLRREFTTDCSHFRFSVQTDAGGWIARVSDSENGDSLYSAYRCSLGAAKVAAAEFAVFRTGAPKSPESVVQQLRWQERW